MKRIILILLPAFLLLAFQNQLEFKVRGIVHDEKGTPVAFATIQSKANPRNAVAADVNGHFMITVSSKTEVLYVSAVGFDRTAVKLKNRDSISVTLKASSQAMTEVVVTALGLKSERRDMAYEVSAPQTSANVQNGLSGRVPGIQIRGMSTYSNNGYTSNQTQSTYDIEGEGYDRITENAFLSAVSNPLSTFSADVDAASYSNIRRFINDGMLPPKDAVRIEEMVNYFNYEYPQPGPEHPFSITTAVTTAPWNAKHKVVMIGLQGKKIPVENLPPSNLVFLIDVSGSMMSPDKLPLVKSSMKLLVDQLREQDKVSIVVYAGNAGLVLAPTSGYEKIKIKDAIDKLEAGGSTAGGEGIRLAYKTAKENFDAKGNNRVILCTDGDFNVGESSDAAMERLIEEERKSGVYLTVLGYGTGNYQDSKMQKLADKGNGNHAYIDGINEAKKVLVNEFGGTLFTIAKDVKLQVEFNPALVAGYRLIGYENRMLAKEDFNDDKKDAGDMGSNHTVTALYEIILKGDEKDEKISVDTLKYQENKIPSGKSRSSELLTVKFRYKRPGEDASRLLSQVVNNSLIAMKDRGADLQFALAVAEFGLILRESEFAGNSSFTDVKSLASNAIGKDPGGYRAEFLSMVTAAEKLSMESSGKIKPTGK